MGLKDFLFGTGGGVKEVSDPYKGVREPLVNWLSGQVGQAGPKYTGQTTAPMSKQENQSFDYLRQYGDSGYGKTYQNANNEINKTLTDGYNPANSPYYQAVKAEASRNLKDVQDNIASNAAGGGRYFSGARLKSQGEAAVDTANSLNKVIGELALQERQNRLNVLPQAFNFGQAEKNLPLQQAKAYQELGALPRELDQNDLDLALQDWIRSEYEYPLQIGSMASGVQTAPLYQQNPRGAIWDFIGKFLEGAGKSVGMAAGGG